MNGDIAPTPGLPATLLPAPPWWRSLVAQRCLLVLLPFLLYAESLGFGLLQLDDHIYYRWNQLLHDGGWQGLIDPWRNVMLSDYAPVSLLTFWFDLAVVGCDHWWFARLHELAWFGAGTLAVHALVLRLTAQRGLAFAVALLYAVHPICGQSVLWLAERKNVVSFALACWCLERYLAVRRGEAGWKSVIGAWLLGLAAVLAKPHAVALPALFAAYELILARDGCRRRLVAWVPPALATAAFIALNLALVRSDLNRAHLGGSLPATIVADGPILVRYLWHTLVPTDLTIYYAVNEHPAWWLAGGAWLLVAAVVALSLVPGRSRRLIAAAWVFAAAGLAPAINLMPQLAPMTDHYHQWILPWLLLILGVLAHDGLERLPDAARPRLRTLAVGGTALFAALLSLARVPEFSSTLSFFRAAVRKQPGAAVNWAMYCYILVTDCATTEASRAGEAAARALACDDLNRVFPEEYAMVVIIAALDLYHQQRFAEYEALVERGIASLPDDARCYSIVVRAQLALSTGKPEAARAILDVVFTSDHQRTSDLLRLRCRQGEILPNELAPMYQVAQVATAGPDANVRLGIEGSHQRLLLMLATAFQKCGDLERAFDVAAVLVNGHPGFAPGRKRLASLYRGLGLPAAADRLESIVTP